MRVIVALGARPNVVKVGPLLPALERVGIACDVAFAGSRSAGEPDDSGGTVSFYGVPLPEPRWFLDIGLGTQAAEAGRAMVAFEELFALERPDAVLAVGDVSATLAAAVSAAKAGLPVVHLDAGLRCGDLSVPEEINRVLISRIASMHLTPTERALETLEDEGIEPERIHFVGSMLAESVIRHLDDAPRDASAGFGMTPGGFILVYFHRAENLGDARRLAGIVSGMARSPLPVLIPDDDGFSEAVRAFGLDVPSVVRVVAPVRYREMVALERDAAVVLTDSSGVQEEACIIGVPCVTVRRCTEQEATVDVGANVLVEADGETIGAALERASSVHRSWNVPKRWDRAVSDRIVRALRRGVMTLS